MPNMKAAIACTGYFIGAELGLNQRPPPGVLGDGRRLGEPHSLLYPVDLALRRWPRRENIAPAQAGTRECDNHRIPIRPHDAAEFEIFFPLETGRLAVSGVL
jgi:hypothetical protein